MLPRVPCASRVAAMPSAFCQRMPPIQRANAQHAVLTGAGKSMRKAMWPVYAAAIRELFEQHINERDAAQMAASLRRVLEAARLRAAEEPPAPAPK